MKQATLHQLKVFEAAARHSSFTRAAEELFLTQPTVSMQIKQLTKSVGLPLFEQVGKRLFLTEAGQELFATCRQIFETIAQFEMSVANLKGLKQGQLRLAVITTAKYFIPRLLGPFCQLYPGIEISLQVTNHEKILERMVNNMDDLYIMSQVPENLDVICEPFLDNPLVVFAPVNHPLAKERNIPIESLTNEPFIMREPGSGTRRAVQQLFDEHRVKVKVKLELGSNEAIKQAIAGGLGISVLSRHTLMPDSSEFSILDVEHFPIKRTWYMVYPSGKQLSIVAHTYYEYLLEAAKKFVEESGFSAVSKGEDIND
ncbi:LysR family transcriptional regulator [Umezakia ovalisporum]|uniref:LysR substrate-binding domain-containing protein n=1 Tax=Umezakia ovalisporum FSS-43 TaxID=2740520 RepID=A0ABT6K6Y2_9CYAN|nr:LysR family transcriptional regulator [Umezakia ovalisporum]MDH6057921.1 LysR substrate-binding domain-containing protein [Umezakia ovalisporum FSS-43]MDH6066842.1 LysR substrate-binding domain-containing protein [Umezakia ovalisporum APH033B]MDH6071945.1 LysR substrate-binding domain-containing protein [Umezakia ovalisporum CobakiLakeA]MDH6078049.1 LysR substrate-binding domain-containing protein [Umezakia ovalisporum FSS-45]MDH6082545.1 LysR substrate-binding domain-containing protein [Um